MNLFAQIRKVDEAKRLVFGRAAEEVVDKADEIMDYASSKPHFQKWSEDVAKDSDGKSLGNVRAMHGKVAAGKLTDIDFNDAEKAIDVCAKVVDDAEWKKVLEGVYTGFSIGGSYVGEKKVEKADGRDVSRYTARPTEISLVDRPCMPTAKFFEVQKADGTLAKVDFQAPAAPAEENTIAGTPEEVEQLCKLMNEGGLKLSDVIAKIAAPVETPKPEDKPAAELQKLDEGALRKSMYTCSSLAQTIASLQSLKSSAEYEAYYEGDKSGVAAKLGAVIALAGQVLIEMVQEEIGEAAMEMSEKAAGLAKYEGEPIAALIKVGARNSAADTERLAKIHALTVELGHACVPAEKVEPAAELAKVETPDLQKMVAEAVAPLQKALTEAGEKIAKLEAQPAPARVAIRAVGKADDVPVNNDVRKVAPAPIKDDLGDVHEAASLIKSIHTSGGMPLGMR